MKIEIFKDTTGDYRVRFVARNGRKLMVSEGYRRRIDVEKCVKVVEKHFKRWS